MLFYLLFAAGTIPYYLLPFWAGLVIENYGFSSTQVGLLLTADMSSATVASLLARYWIARWPWRPVLVVSLAACAVANFMCLWADGFMDLFILRCVAGLSAGTFAAFAYAVFAVADDPDREFSFALAIQVVLGAAAMLLWPQVSVSLGPDLNPAWAFALPGFVLLFPVLFYTQCPASNPGAQETSVQSTSGLDFRVLIALVAIAVLFTALTAIWVAVEQLGSEGGLSAGLVSVLLSLGLLFSFAGALAPAFTEHLFSRNRQVLFSYALLLGSVALLAWDSSAWPYAVALCLYNFFYSFVIPFQSAWVATSDGMGRNAVLVPVAQGVGVSAGPMLAGYLMAGVSINAVIIASAGLLIFSATCVHWAGDPLPSGRSE